MTTETGAERRIAWRIPWLDIALIGVAFALAAVLYGRLPERIPTHWNLRGEVDGTTPKPWGPFVVPLIMVVMRVVFAVMPYLSPRGFRVERFRRVWSIVVTALLAVFLAIHGIALLAAMGVPLAMHRWMPILCGALFVVMGNYMGKLTRNFWMGIRTPWTLANEEVWTRTHRLGGKLMVAAGIGCLLVGALAPSPSTALVVMIAAIAAAAVAPMVYSYVIYRRIEGDPRQPRSGGANDVT